MSEFIASSRFASLVYNALIHSPRRLNRGFTALWWQRIWERSCRRFRGPVRTVVHGRPVILNFGNTYPVYSRRFPSLNNPLVELVYQAYTAKSSPIIYVDVGAATGDSALLVDANCPEMVGQFVCIDGDREFFGYLRANLAHLCGARFHLALLSASEGNIRSLVRTHPGTASALGNQEVPSVTLDAVLDNEGVAAADVLKIDVDGFDGKVLLGAGRTLRRHRPAVIFEWHPILCEQTGNNWTDHFEMLAACGYRDFAWFSKYGEFSHFMRDYDEDSVQMLADLCLKSKTYPDWHYDIVALPEDSPIPRVSVADLAFARGRLSRF